MPEHFCAKFIDHTASGMLSKFYVELFTAFAVSVLAGIGLDAILRGHAPRRLVIVAAAGVVGFALLGAVGGLQPIAESLAIPQRAEGVRENAAELRQGALRLLLFSGYGLGDDADSFYVASDSGCLPGANQVVAFNNPRFRGGCSVFNVGSSISSLPNNGIEDDELDAAEIERTAL